MRNPEEINDIFSLRDEEEQKFTDAELQSIAERTPADMILPFGTRRRYMERMKVLSHMKFKEIEGGEINATLTATNLITAFIISPEQKEDLVKCRTQDQLDEKIAELAEDSSVRIGDILDY